ncbi:MAG: hypothetical protein ACTSX4_04630 [Candidatus Helarchaeota archaeon]
MKNTSDFRVGFFLNKIDDIPFFFNLFNKNEIKTIILKYGGNKDFLKEFELVANKFEETINIFTLISLKTLTEVNSEIKKLNLTNFNGEIIPNWPCPNDKRLNLELKKIISNLDLEKIQGILFSDFHYPLSTSESIKLVCFCNSCQEEAARPNAAEDIKIRDLFDKIGKDVNLNQVKQQLISKKIKNLKYEDVIKNKKFKKWHVFRCNSFTKLMGNLLIHSRNENKDLVVGAKLKTLESSKEAGQIYEDLATYLDFISAEYFFKKSGKIASFNIKQINKQLKKAEGKIYFYPIINVQKKINKLEINAVKRSLLKEGIEFAFFNLN